jgi:hypothetical protein
MNIRINARYLAAFLALTVLCGTSHDFAHHFAAAAACGEFGHKTFNSFSMAASCEGNTLARTVAVLAGPALTYGLIWYGFSLLRSPDEARRQFGFGLIFANFPIKRMIFALLLTNYEQALARDLIGDTDIVHAAVNGAIWTICLPPLVAAFRAFKSRWKIALYLGFLLLPFAFVVTFAGVFVENYLLLEKHVLAGELFGVPALIFVVEGVSLAIFHLFRPSSRCRKVQMSYGSERRKVDDFAQAPFPVGV